MVDQGSIELDKFFLFKWEFDSTFIAEYVQGMFGGMRTGIPGSCLPWGEAIFEQDVGESRRIMMVQE